MADSRADVGGGHSISMEAGGSRVSIYLTPPQDEVAQGLCTQMAKAKRRRTFVWVLSIEARCWPRRPEICRLEFRVMGKINSTTSWPLLLTPCCFQTSTLWLSRAPKRSIARIHASILTILHVQTIRGMCDSNPDPPTRTSDAYPEDGHEYEHHILEDIICAVGLLGFLPLCLSCGLSVCS